MKTIEDIYRKYWEEELRTPKGSVIDEETSEDAEEPEQAAS